MECVMICRLNTNIRTLISIIASTAVCFILFNQYTFSGVMPG